MVHIHRTMLNDTIIYTYTHTHIYIYICTYMAMAQRTGMDRSTLIRTYGTSELRTRVKRFDPDLLRRYTEAAWLKYGSRVRIMSIRNVWIMSMDRLWVQGMYRGLTF